MIRGIARDSIQWESEPYFGTQVPVHVDGARGGNVQSRQLLHSGAD